VVIRSSSSRDVGRLIADLLDDSDTRRDAAVARLRIIGVRADERLAALIASNAPPAARVAALRALEGRTDPLALRLARAASADADAGVACAAIAVLRGRVAQEGGTDALDALSGLALDPRREPDVRLAALDALSELPPALVRPLFQRMPASLQDPDRPGTALERLDDPLEMHDWISRHGSAPLSTLHEAVTRCRDREAREASPRVRQAWTAARGAAHAALARRGSRVALYDLRESFDAASGPLPLDFLAAMGALGDTSCLLPLAHAWAVSTDGWWRDRLQGAARTIVERNRLSGRHATIKRLRSQHPGFV
jgi:hypothetical protein